MDNHEHGPSFVDLPSEIKIACFERLFGKWYIQINEDKSAAVPSSFTSVNGPIDHTIMTVSKDFYIHTKLALLKLFQRRLELGSLPSLRKLASKVEKYDLAWIVERIESITLDMAPLVPIPQSTAWSEIICLHRFDRLCRVDLIQRWTDLSGYPTLSVQDYLLDDQWDWKIEFESGCSRGRIFHFSGSSKLLYIKLQERGVKIFGTTLYRAQFGEDYGIYQGDAVIFKVDLSNDKPVFVEKKAQLDLSGYHKVRDENGALWMFRHYLHWVWDEVRDRRLFFSDTREYTVGESGVYVLVE